MTTLEPKVSWVAFLEWSQGSIKESEFQEFQDALDHETVQGSNIDQIYEQ